MTVMNPKVIGNPLVAWRDDSVLQIGWGTHAVTVAGAPRAMSAWLALVNGERSRASLMQAAGRLDIPGDQAEALLDRLLRAGIASEHRSRTRVRIHPCGLLVGALSEAMVSAGVDVDDASDVVVFPQGQVPSLLGAPTRFRRLIPVWFETRAVHVGPVLDVMRGPCPQCIDRTWAATDPRWSAVVAQAVSVPTWSEPVQLVQAAAAVALIAEDPRHSGVGDDLRPVRAGSRLAGLDGQR